MKRTYSGKAGGLVSSSQGEQGFWPSYADMMSAVALILFFLMLLSYIQNLITGNNLQNTQELLENTQELLSSTELELASTEEALSLTKKEVEDAEAELEKVNIDLDEVKLTLAEKEQDIASQDKLLADQKALIGEQEEYMKAASEELLAMRGQMQTIAVLRLSILEQIRDSVVSVMGDASKVKIGDNGNIVLSEGVFFDVGSSEIKAGAVPTLNQLADVFQRFLANKDNIKYVDSIVISGHTDSTGTDENNRVLSTDRANAVLGYLLDNSNGKLQEYASYFCAAGYGETRPVASNDTEAGRAQNRRIEISIILRDDSIMEIVESYLDIDVPAAVQNPGYQSREGEE
jgi:chemotaxis protein MotB